MTETPPDGVRRVLLSGPIGAGKSAAAEILARRSAVVIEADRLGHAVLEPDGEAHAAVALRWPQTVARGRIDRAALADIVFADPGELSALEALTHPHIGARIEHLAAEAGDRLVVVELPLMRSIAGNGWHRLVVVAPAAERFARAVARGMAPDDVRRRMSSQPGDESWTSRADTVIVNDGDLHDLESALDDWWQENVSR